jgi:glycine cleavage system protein P-like pyridoxal-binding family
MARKVAAHFEGSVINANYLLTRLRAKYKVAYDHTCQHEFVLSGDYQKAGVKVTDIAKRMLTLACTRRRPTSADRERGDI